MSDLKADKPNKSDRVYEYWDPTLRTQWVKWLLIAGIALSLVSFLSDAAEFRLLRDIQSGAFESQAALMAAAESSDSRQAVIGVAYFVLFVAIGIAILMWIYRANSNAHALGAAGMRFRPGWAVGWYFIPILNLWKPYQAMKEIWKVSADPRTWQAQERSPLLPWWWFLWIVSGILGQAYFRLSLRAEEIDALKAASALGMLTDAIDIPLNLIFIAIAGRICQMQVAHAQGRAGAPGTAAAPPGSVSPPLPASDPR